jgi:hypothetical protein
VTSSAARTHDSERVAGFWRWFAGR